MSSGFRWSYSLSTWAVVQPRASRSMTNSTEIRVPLTIGLPTSTLGSIVIRSSQVMACVSANS